MIKLSNRHTLAAALIIASSLFALPQSASAETRGGYTAIAQAQVNQPTRLVAPGKGKRVACNGKTATECCTGLSYCTCLYSPMGGANPTDCFNGTKPED
jgi:hypothetical protein